MFFSPLEQFTIIKLIPLTISGGLDFSFANSSSAVLLFSICCLALFITSKTNVNFLSYFLFFCTFIVFIAIFSIINGLNNVLSTGNVSPMIEIGDKVNPDLISIIVFGIGVLVCVGVITRTYQRWREKSNASVIHINILYHIIDFSIYEVEIKCEHGGKAFDKTITLFDSSLQSVNIVAGHLQQIMNQIRKIKTIHDFVITLHFSSEWAPSTNTPE